MLEGDGLLIGGNTCGVGIELGFDEGIGNGNSGVDTFVEDTELGTIEGDIFDEGIGLGTIEGDTFGAGIGFGKTAGIGLHDSKQSQHRVSHSPKFLV